MYRPEKLLLTNFMSHKNSVFGFENKQATMVYGTNSSDDGQVSNGSGKSAILEGISVALIGSPLRNVSSKDLVREGSKELTVTLILKHTKSNEVIEISRTIFNNTKSAELLVTIDGEIPKQLLVKESDKVDVRSGNDFILNHLEVTREDLLNYFLISKEKHSSFLGMSDTAKKCVIGRFSQSDLLDPVYDVVGDEIDEIATKVRVCETEIAKLQGRKETYIEEKDKFDVNELKLRKTEKLRKISDAVLILSEESVDLTKQIHEIEKEVATDKVAITFMANPDTGIEKLVLLENELKKSRDELKAFRSELNEIQKVKGDVVKALSGAVECPKCEFEFSITNKDINIKSAREKKDQIDEMESEIEGDVKSTANEIVTQDRLLEKQQSDNAISKRALRLAKEAVDTKISEIDRKRRRIVNIEKDIEEYDIQVQTINNYVIKDLTDEYQVKIDLVDDSIVDQEEKIAELDIEKFDKQEWNGIFTKFKTHLSNKAIGVIEAHCNEYLKRIKTNLSVKMDGYKINKTGAIREKISTTVLRNGMIEGLFDRFSSGEKARIEVAMILSLQKLINMNTAKGGLDLCFLDEVIESVDSDGIEGIMNALNSLGQTIVVVTHGTFEKRYPYISRVEKIDGISIIN
jgi:exonuclease SbcC